MPRKSSSTTAKVESGVLYTEDPLTTGAKVGSSQWFTWLATAASFYYESPRGAFTARSERKQKGGVYWIAYRRIAGHLFKRYMGRPDSLTADRLAETADYLAKNAERKPM